MGVIWLIQSHMQNHGTADQFRRALSNFGLDFISVPLVPFSKDLPQIDLPHDPSNIVCWGPGFIPRMLNYPNLSPGIWYDHEKFRWSAFRLHWQELMMCVDAQVETLDSAVANLTSEPIFMRPDADNKAFTGGLFSNHNRPKSNPMFGQDMAVIVAEPQNIEHEWRFFIVDQKIVAASSYRVAGFPNMEGSIPQAAIELAEAAAEIWCPDDVFCLDIGFNGARYGIIEANCFNASRLYQADPISVIEAVNRFLSE